MRIVFLTDALTSGGLETHLQTFINELIKRGHQVLVHSYFTDPVFFQGIRDPHGLFHHMIGTDDALADVAPFAPEVVHSHPFYAITRGSQLAEALHKPFFITIHGLYNSGLDNSESGVRVCEKASSVIAVDDGVAALLAGCIPTPEKLVVIPNGIDLQTFSPLAPSRNRLKAPGFNPDCFTITFVTRFQDGKETPVFQLLEHAPLIAKRLRGLNLILVGFGSFYDQIQELSNIACQKSKFLHVFLTGPQLEVRPYLAMADLVLGCGRSALEAMACQRPVFAAYQTGFAGLIDKSSFDELIFSLIGYWNPLHEKAFIEHLIKLGRSKIRLRRSAEQGLEIIKNRFNIIDAVTQLENIYHQHL
ncbi:MAG: glycosyltransferase family 4 protein [Syntrophomonas sp.]